MKKFLLWFLVLGSIVGAFFIGKVVGTTVTLRAVEEKLNSSDEQITITGPSISQYPNTVINANNGDLRNVDFVYASNYRSVTIRFVADENIDNLKLKVEMSDSTGFLLDSQIITVGDVIKGQQYTVTVTLTNSAITEGKVIKTTELNVYSGTLTN